MKHLFFLLLPLIMLSACYSIRFENPAPTNGKELSVFPKALWGSFLDKDSTVVTFWEDAIIYENERDSARLTDEHIVLKKIGEYYILSYQDSTDNTGWDVYPFRIEQDLLIGYAIYSDKEDNEELRIKQIEQITNVNRVLDEDGELSYYLINPTKRQFRKMLKSGLFIEEIRFERIQLDKK